MYKSKLQEICQRSRWQLPDYEIKREGPKHNPRFQATVVVDGVTFQSRDTCSTMKQAQNEVAHAALLYFLSPSTGSSRSTNVLANDPSHQQTRLQERAEGCQVTEISVSAPVVVEDSKTKRTLHASNELTNSITTHQSCEEIQEVGRIPESNVPTSIVKEDRTTQVSPYVTRDLTKNTSSQHILQEHKREFDRLIESSDKKDMNHLCKSQLQTYTQKHNLYLPTYIPEREGPPHACRFRCKVVAGEQIFESQEFFPTLREAENAAAKIALESLAPNASQEGDCLVYKNMLQELAQKRSFLLPVYTTARSGPPHSPTFLSYVEVAGKVFSGQEAKTKKLAEMSAAKVAYMSLTSGIPSPTPSLPLPSELQEKPHGASPAKSSVSSNLLESPLIPPRKAAPDVSSKWVEVHEEEPPFPDHVREPHVSSLLEKKMVTSPMLENPTDNDTTSSSVDEMANKLIVGTGNHSSASGVRVVVRPWKPGMTLPLGAELEFRDDEWVAFRPPKP